MGRPTLDKKEYNIKLRVDSDMRSWIEKMSLISGVSMSDYLRILIESDMSNKYSKNSRQSK